MKSGQSTVNPLKTGQWTYDKLSSFTFGWEKGKGEGKGRGHVLICNSKLTDFGQAGHKYPERNDVRVLDVMPFERDDGKAFRLAAIYRAFRTSLSQRPWDSHQPQEEPHSRYLPHLQATSKILLPLPGEIPPLRRSLGARSLSLRGGATEDCGPRGHRRVQRRGSYPTALATAAPAGSGAASARSGQGGVRGSVHRQMLRAGVLLLARTCLYQTAPERPEAELFLPLPRRLQCGDSYALTEHLSGSAGELRSSGGTCLPSCLSSGHGGGGSKEAALSTKG